MLKLRYVKSGAKIRCFSCGAMLQPHEAILADESSNYPICYCHTCSRIIREGMEGKISTLFFDLPIDLLQMVDRV